MKLDAIFVPQGVEYQTVRRAFDRTHALAFPLIVAIPVGIDPVRQFLKTWKTQHPQVSRVLVMGLAGSLSPQFAPGRGTLCHECVTPDGTQVTTKSNWVESLSLNLPEVRACSVETAVVRVEEKRQLYRNTQAQIVEMEGLAVFEAFSEAAMVRVISDGSDRNLPDLSDAIDPTGRLKSLPLTFTFVRQPRAAFYLIRGAIAGLKTLKKIAETIARSMETNSEKIKA
ncbi:Adenosylhopane nucleosidase HpnG [Geitlerinema sp. FC II]|nr:hypothetical protein [Geitlerinema sp. CS-897]PPT05997.1 Adenosylhopane nucleosidase HpnG [Geitlerinema sp. FC II]